LWHCKCDCGGTATTRTFMLNSGRTKSCGCWHSEEMRERNTKPRVTLTEKACPTCKAVKASALFAKDPSRPDGMSSQCKTCKNVEYKRRNRGRVIEQTTARKKHVKRATPAWADRREIVAFYKEAARLSQETGVKHHVDHIFPLRGIRVSGLHIPGNLQVIPWSENLKKSNRMLGLSGLRTAERIKGVVPPQT